MHLVPQIQKNYFNTFSSITIILINDNEDNIMKHHFEHLAISICYKITLMKTQIQIYIIK